MRSSILALSLILTGASLAAQTLNPVVTVLPRATSVVPAECAEGLAPAPVPRVTPEEVQAAAPKPTRPAVPQAPPSMSLRGGLREIQDAAERGDREAFRDALARVHALVDSYPPGGEKNAAGDVLKVYDDLQAIWDFQFQSPTGAFFDASTDNLLARMKSYPEYQRSIARQTIVDATGTRFYPTRETRDFLARESASRLKRLGVSAAAAKPAPAVERPAASPVERRTSAARKPATHAGSKPKPRTKPRVTAVPNTAKATPPSASKPARKTTPSPPKVAEAAAPPVSKPVVKTKPPAPAPSPLSKPSPEPAATPTPTTTTAAAPPPPPATTSTTATVTREAAPAEPRQPEPATKPGSRRNLILPLILIVLGVGVLIVLFRTSS